MARPDVNEGLNSKNFIVSKVNENENLVQTSAQNVSHRKDQKKLLRHPSFYECAG